MYRVITECVNGNVRGTTPELLDALVSSCGLCPLSIKMKIKWISQLTRNNPKIISHPIDICLADPNRMTSLISTL